mmetsp:Transcript_25002/g.27688  ORF Transcript_25002/g.27688 Transcript_25002/m.27688 type:complete len:369 (+) Transcript_25002:34-1140(+)
MLNLIAPLLLVSALGTRFPGRSWERATPESQGMSSERLDNAFDYAFPRFSLTTRCVSVFRNGYLVGDRYNIGVNPTDASISWSVSKAVFSTLIGIAEKAGLLHTTDLASKYIEEWRGVPGASDITIDHLLRHDSGRYYDPVTDFVLPQSSRNQTLFALDLRMQTRPGTDDQYNQMAFQTMERIWRVATGGTVAQQWRELLPNKIGFEAASFWQEISFLNDVPNGDGGLVYGGLHISCHDLGRFGHLWLNQGVWNGEELVTREFWAQSLRRALPPRVGRGYQWGGGPNHRATGAGDQFVSFNLDNGVVISRLGDLAGLDFSARELVNRVLAAVMDQPAASNQTKEEWENDEDERVFRDQLLALAKAKAE